MTRYRVTFRGGRHRSKTQFMGRFGGGWNWKVGITAGSWRKGHGTTILVAYLVAYLVDECRIEIKPRKTVNP